MSMTDRLLTKASALIEQRVSQIMDAPSGPRVRRLDDVISVEPSETASSGYPLKWAYAGQLQVTENRVFVVPFVVESYAGSYENDGIVVAPKIGGSSIFSENRPYLNRQSGGGSVYLAKRWELSVVPTPESEQPFAFVAEYQDCEIIQLGVSDPYPRDFGEVEWPYGVTDPEEVSVTTSSCQSFSLIGVYTAEGRVFPGYSARKVRVTNFTDPDTGVLVPSVTEAYFKRETPPPP